MPASGSSIFTDADGYQARLRDIFDLLVMHPREFHARLTWVELPSLALLRAQEASARVAYVKLPPKQVYIIFPNRRDAPLICGGVELQFGDIMVHSQGEHLHQRTAAPTSWGSISLTAASLLTFGRAIAGDDLIPPHVGQVLRPRPADRQRLLRLHAQAGRVAETELNRLTNKEVIRALEQDLIWILIICLSTGAQQGDHEGRREQARISLQFETLLAQHPFRLLRARDICSALGVSEQTLRSSCSAVLGMSPGHYQRLRRLKLVRTELMRDKPATATSAEVVMRYGFANLHRFVTEYCDAYGEMPPLTPSDPMAGQSQRFPILP